MAVHIICQKLFEILIRLSGKILPLKIVLNQSFKLIKMRLRQEIMQEILIRIR